MVVNKVQHEAVNNLKNNTISLQHPSSYHLYYGQHALKQPDKKAAETLDNLLINYSIHKITFSMCLIVHMDIMTEENYFIICLLFFQFLK